MHRIEDAVEMMIHNIADSSTDMHTKRRLIHTLYHLQENSDCGFTNRRCTKEMVECGYTFLFEPVQMWDYGTRKDFYRKLHGQTEFEQGDLYIYDDVDGRFPLGDGKVCVDSGSPTWEKMVAVGRITGEGAKPMAALSTAEALCEAKKIADGAGGLSPDLLEGFRSLVVLSDTFSGFSKEMGDEWFQVVLGCTKAQYQNGEALAR